MPEDEAGMKRADFRRRHCISGATLYKHKAKSAGTNAKLMERLAEAEFDNAMVKDAA